MSFRYYAVYSPLSKDVFNDEKFLPRDVQAYETAEFTRDDKTRQMMVDEMMKDTPITGVKTALGPYHDFTLKHPAVVISATLAVNMENAAKLSDELKNYGQRYNGSAAFAPAPLNVGTIESSTVVIGPDALHPKRTFSNDMLRQAYNEVVCRKDTYDAIAKMAARSSGQENAEFNPNNPQHIKALQFAYSWDSFVQDANKADGHAQRYAQPFFAAMAKNGTTSLILQMPKLYDKYLHYCQEIHNAVPQLPDVISQTEAMKKVCSEYTSGPEVKYDALMGPLAQHAMAQSNSIMPLSESVVKFCEEAGVSMNSQTAIYFHNEFLTAAMLCEGSFGEIAAKALEQLKGYDAILPYNVTRTVDYGNLQLGLQRYLEKEEPAPGEIGESDISDDAAEHNE